MPALARGVKPYNSGIPILERVVKNYMLVMPIVVM